MNIFYNALWIFIIYGFLGWCMEVIYAATDTGKFVNRGFLNGPICPIYGFGILVVASLLTPVSDNIFLLFTGAMLLTSILEFVTGFILEKLFKDKWWDYSDMPFNIMGYVCLKFSIVWGLICVFITKIVYPATDKLIELTPRVLGIVLLSVFFGILIVDFIITLINVLKFPKRMKAILDIENALNTLSIELGSGLAENTLNVQEKGTEIKNEIVEKGNEINEKIIKKSNAKIAEMEELKNKYIALLSEKNFVYKRLSKAFPDIQNGKYKDIFEKIKKAATGKLKEKRK